MAKTLKLVYAITLFLFLFLTIEEVASKWYDFIPTSQKCTSHEDCPTQLICNQPIGLCVKGYCNEIISRGWPY
jgi:hypothetical protein